MSVLHGFVDESTRRNDYVICAATVPTSELASARKALHQLRAPKQNFIHFVSESDARRGKILTAMSELKTTTTIYVARSRDQVAARTAILETMIPELRNTGVRRLILDSRQGQDHRDRATIYGAVRGEPEPEFRYDHHPSASEPLLWVPDAVAWAWGRGGRWKSQTEDLGLVTRVVAVQVP